MTYRATQSPLSGGFAAFRDFVNREYIRIQRAFATKAETEVGTFTPTFTFATIGDLSLSYTTQIGNYWRIGDLCHIAITLNATPTYTTASGEARIGGLPFQCVSDQIVVMASQISSSSVTYPTGRTYVFGYISNGHDYARIAATGSATTTNAFDASEFTSGSSTGTIRLTGFYPFK